MTTTYTEKQIKDTMVTWSEQYAKDVDDGVAATHGEFSHQEVADYFLQLLKERN